MNERIKELAAQAGLQPFEDCGPGYVYKMEKFARLIVTECIDVIKNESMDSTDEWEDGLQIAIEAIKHNLGDKE
jgi:hypothetical protein